MKFYVKQRVFSWKDRFDIYDENGNSIYRVEGQVFSLGKKLHFFSEHDEEVSFIHQKLVSLLPCYYVNMNGEDVAEVVRKISLLRPKYVVNGPDWEVEGDFFAHEYTINSSHGSIARVSKRWISFGDSYEIDIREKKDEILALSVVLIIDAVLEAEQRSSNSANDD